jgi:predicted dehydrogenase
MSENTVRVGVVGAGIWGTMHARAYHQHAAAELVGICDLDEKRAAQVASTYGVPNCAESVAELLALGLDAVSVATPDNAHLEPVLAALEAGVHVLVEKPLATSEEDCLRMIEAARSHNVHLMVDWHNRWNPPAYEAWRSIRAGELGDIQYMYYRLSDTIYVPTTMLPWAADSSVLHFLGSHAIDTVCWLLDESPVEVSCKRKDGILAGMGIDTADMYLTTLEFPSGATVLVENSWVLPQSAPALIDHRWEIIGTSGVLYFDATHNRAVAKYTAETPGGFPNPSFPDMFVTPEVHGRQLGFCVEPMSHFVESVRDGKAPLTCGEDGLRNTRILLAAEEAASRGRPVGLA